MAYDILGGFEDDRDFSIGLVGPIWEPGQKPSEVKTTKQAKAFAEIVDREIKNNAAIGVLKKQSGVLDRDDERKFKNFYIAWHSWLAREVQGKKKPTKKTVAELKKWRADNALWTQKFSKMQRSEIAPHSQTLPQENKPKSKWPMFAAVGAVLGVVLLGRK